MTLPNEHHNIITEEDHIIIRRSVARCLIGWLLVWEGVSSSIHGSTSVRASAIHSFPLLNSTSRVLRWGGGHAEYTRLCTCSPGRPSENREQIHDEQGTIASRVCRRACLPSLTPDAAVIPLTLVALVHRHNAWT